MSAKYRHVLPNLGHFAAYILKQEPYGMVIPLIDRVLITRDVDGEPTDMIVGTVINDQQYKIADEVDKNTKFMGYIDPMWLQAKGSKMMDYEDKLKEYGRTWQQRTTPIVIPAAVEELFGEPDFEEEETPTPPRKRKGR